MLEATQAPAGRRPGLVRALCDWLKDADIAALPVMEGNLLVCVISDRDVIRHAAISVSPPPKRALDGF
ncbi:hypothetical protein [Tropicimonas marinistellae]|uniref:hypothetical protein n=1 Tax=Tropicimonas marinistellae TaxID=1739787 RepID=UPI00082B542D|nr:hypothetical protein [Tropicimonas marinistellae]